MPIHSSVPRCRLCRAGAMPASAIAALLAPLMAGCPGSSILIEPALTEQAGVRAAGVFAESVRPNTATYFEVDVASGLRLEVIAEPSEGATLGIGPISSPDGKRFSARPGATKSSSDDVFQVQARGFGDLGVGLHFLGASASDGRWRFALVCQPSQYEALRGRVREVSVTEKLMLAAFILNGGLTSDDNAGALLRFFFPELDGISQPIGVTLRINLLDEDDEPAFPPATDGGGGSGGGGGGDPNGGGGGGGADPNDSTGGGNPTQPTVPNTPIDGADLQLVVQTGDAVPGQAGATFTWLSNPLIDQDGRVAFWGAYTGGSGNAGLYVWESGTLTRVVDDDPNATSAPGLPAGSVFGTFDVQYDGFSPHLSWASGDRLIFTAATDGSPLPNALFRYRVSDGNMLRIIDCESFKSLFDNVGDTFLCEFFNPVVSDDGYAVFTNRYTYFTTSNQFVFRNRGLFFSNGVESEAMLAPEFPRVVPGVPNGDFIEVELLPAMNYGVDVVLQASYESPVETDGDQGVYVYTGGQLFRLVDNGSGRNWPGLSVGTVIGESATRYQRVAVGPLRDVAIDTTLTVNGVKRDAVILSDRSRWAEIRPAGQSATDLLTGVNEDGHLVTLANGKPYYWNGLSNTDLSTTLPAEIAASTVTWANFGGSLNNAGQVLLRYTRDGKPGLALWTGAKLVVVADAALGLPAATFDELLSGALPSLDTIDRSGVVKDRPEVDRVGRSNAINDAADFVFRVGTPGADSARDTADDYQAIYIGRGQ